MGEGEILERLSAIGREDIADLMEITTSGFRAQLMKVLPDGTRVVKPETKNIRRIKQKVTTYLAKKSQEAEDGKSQEAEDREVIETEVELYSAVDAMMNLAKIKGMITEHTDVTTKGESIQVVKVAVDLDKV
jgi:hypothetical protein